MQQSREEMPEAFVQHSIAGRVRLRVPARRGDTAFFARVAEALSGTGNVISIATNPLTGSILIRHSGPVEPILAQARDLFVLVSAAVAEPVRRPSLSIGNPSARATLINPVAAAAVGFGALAIYQVARGRVAGTATESLWHAYRMFREAPKTAGALAAVGLVQLARGRVLSPAISLAYYALTARRMAHRPERS